MIKYAIRIKRHIASQYRIRYKMNRKRQYPLRGSSPLLLRKSMMAQDNSTPMPASIAGMAVRAFWSSGFEWSEFHD